MEDIFTRKEIIEEGNEEKYLGNLLMVEIYNNIISRVNKDKLGLSWAKLRSSWDLTLLLFFENLFSLNPALKWKKNHPMVPPLDHFQGKNKNCSSLARTIRTSRRS